MKSTRNSNRRSCGAAIATFAFLAIAACGGGSSGDKDRPPCDGDPCGAHGTCVESEGAAQCVCSPGFSGKTCGACAPGYHQDGEGGCASNCLEGQQDNDGDGICSASCAADSCGEDSVCDDSSGTIACACAKGFQDRDGDGSCLPDCGHAGLSCAGAHMLCTDASGIALCDCEEGWRMREDGTCGEDRRAEWTIMVYLDGDNDLHEYARDDLDEMAALAASADDVSFLVLHDGNRRKDTRLYKVAGGVLTELRQDDPDVDAFIFDDGEADMNDWQTLKRFGQWAAERYPARRYGLFMWNHGGGWKDGVSVHRCKPVAGGFRDFAWDDNSSLGAAAGIELSQGDYGRALKAITEAAGKKLDLVGFDACLMGMYEVAAATQEHADYLVASEEVEPAEGWPWNVFLKKLSANPSMEAPELGREIVEAYHATRLPDYEGESPNSTLSLVDLGTMDQVHGKLAAFADALAGTIATGSGRAAVKAIRDSVQEFDYAEHVDLVHLARLVGRSGASGVGDGAKSAARDLAAQLESTILLSRTNNYDLYGETIDVSNAYGMAIFFPADFAGDYNRTDFAIYKRAPWAPLSTWDEFLDEYL